MSEKTLNAEKAIDILIQLWADQHKVEIVKKEIIKK